MPNRTLVTRRRFVATGAMAALAASFPVMDALAEDDVRLTRLPVLVPNLPPALAGTTIAQVSDLHLYHPEPHPASRRALAVLERERPDLLVLTGDQWDNPGGEEGYVSWLRARPTGLPVVAVLGNHEYATSRSDRRGLIRAAERIHTRGDAALLVNATSRVPLRGTHLRVVGLDDLRHGRPEPMAAADGIDPVEPQLWLFHEPGQADLPGWPESAAPFLMLAGHTHGGQIRLPLLRPVTPSGSGNYVAGSYRTPRGPLYVSRGVGASIPRIRYRCPAEVALFDLQPGHLGSS